MPRNMEVGRSEAVVNRFHVTLPPSLSGSELLAGNHLTLVLSLFTGLIRYSATDRPRARVPLEGLAKSPSLLWILAHGLLQSQGLR